MAKIERKEGFTSKEIIDNCNRLANDPKVREEIIKKCEEDGYHAHFIDGFLYLGAKDIHVSSRLTAHSNVKNGLL